MEIKEQDLLIFFATQDSRNKQVYEAPFCPLYASQAFYLDRREDSQIPHPRPKEIDDCIECRRIRLNTFDHFIWISKRICEAEEIHFWWIYSHELQHLRQSLKNPNLLILNKLLQYIDYYEDYNINNPIEFDCEVNAKKTAIDKFDKDNDKVDSYLKRMKTKSTDQYKKERYSKLLELEIVENYDVEKLIINDICRHKEKLIRIQEKRLAAGKSKYSIDFDILCACRDAHEAILSGVRKID
jgi:hypothetical protein